jgi:aspartate/methionine/tyrosine aminotransferase
VTPLVLASDQQWRLDLVELDRLLRSKTRLVVVNLPQNPTGMLPSRADFDALCALCERRGITLFCDEMYRYGECEPSDLLPAACTMWRGGVSLGGLSKPFGLAGLRIGWIAAQDPTVLRHCAVVKDYLTICSSAPSEVLAIIALRSRAELVARNRAIALANLELLDGFFERWGAMFEWVRPRAWPVGFPRLKTAGSIDDLAARLVAKTGVLLLPGSIFDHPGNHFRIGFGRTNMPEALQRFEEFLTM